MKNIHILPTDKPSNITIRTKTNELMYSYKLFSSKNGKDINVNQHIYITSDEEIKEGYYLDLTHNIVMKAVFYPSSDKNCKKIILTTDQDLIKDGVQEISNEFLEWFVKNPSCEWVEVTEYLDSGFSYGYRIIIPKEEQKQETLNEVALEFAKDYHELYETNNLGAMQFGFCWGAKWQQERMYSEEEVKHLMTLAFEQGFKKADVVEAGLEAKETDTEVNWIFLKHKK